MPSMEADRALRRAVDAFRESLRGDGFEVYRTGYGVHAADQMAEHAEDARLESEGMDRYGSMGMTRLPAWMIGLPNHDGSVLVPVDRRGVCTAEAVLGLGVGEDVLLHQHAAVEVDEMVLATYADELRLRP